MNRTPELSVVMSVYNTERFLDKAIRSILDQQFSDYEFIIVDDASTDGTMNLVQKWAAADDRIKIFRNETRLGLTKSLNRAISQTTAPWIARQDADDVSIGQRLRLQMEYLREKSAVGLIGTFYKGVDEQGEGLYTVKFPTEDAQIKRFLKTINVFCHGSVVFSKRIFLKAGRYPEEYPFGQDYALWLRFIPLTQMSNLPECLYSKRLHGQSVSQRHPERWGVIQQIKLDAGLMNKPMKLERFIAREFFLHGRYLFKMRQYRSGIMSFLKGAFY